MEKAIWVIGNDRNEILEAQRRINSTGSMRAVCLLSTAAVQRAVGLLLAGEGASGSLPSLIVVDYGMAAAENFLVLSLLKNQQAIAGVPLFFMTEEGSGVLDEDCFSKGALVVLNKPFTRNGILRMERMAWQHEVTKNYEKILQKQAGDLQAAKEIVRLNKQLQSRNELLYRVFGRYFPDKVLEMILDKPEGAVIGGEKQDLTVMLSDLRGFTSLSEDLEPEAVTGLLNFYFGKMTEVITGCRGTVIEFLGDGILAVFGAPLASKEHTADAVAAAITMQNCMSEVNAFCREQGYPVLEMGIGIHRGEAFIGNIGSEKIMRYNVVGKVVNECSRIEGYSVGGQVLVSGEALEDISCPVEIHKRMSITAKGIRKPISVCEVIGIGGKNSCRIEKAEADTLTAVEDWILFNLYRVEEKLVAEEPVAAQLTEFSRKRAVVRIAGPKKEELAGQLGMYADVEVFAAGKDGRAVFNGVYAKVLEHREGEIMLHFTHVSRSFQNFANSVLQEEAGGAVSEQASARMNWRG